MLELCKDKRLFQYFYKCIFTLLFFQSNTSLKCNFFLDTLETVLHDNTSIISGIGDSCTIFHEIKERWPRWWDEKEEADDRFSQTKISGPKKKNFRTTVLWKLRTRKVMPPKLSIPFDPWNVLWIYRTHTLPYENRYNRPLSYSISSERQGREFFPK